MAPGPSPSLRLRLRSLCALRRKALSPQAGRGEFIDPLLGLIPVIGDAISAALSSYIVWEAKQLGLPSWKLAQMIGNVAVDTVVGAVPFVGDFFDLGFKSNKRNVRIVLDHLEKTGRLTPKVIEGTAVRVDERPASPGGRGRVAAQPRTG